MFENNSLTQSKPVITDREIRNCIDFTATNTTRTRLLELEVREDSVIIQEDVMSANLITYYIVEPTNSISIMTFYDRLNCSTFSYQELINLTYMMKGQVKDFSTFDVRHLAAEAQMQRNIMQQLPAHSQAFKEAQSLLHKINKLLASQLFIYYCDEVKLYSVRLAKISTN